MAEDVVRAKRFELVGDDGSVHAVLSASPENGLVGLHVKGQRSDTTLISIGIEGDENAPYVMLRSEDGEARAILTIMEGEYAAVQLRNANGKTRNIYPEG